jgi:Chaperone for flagella basal body P-ring formation
MKRIAMAMIGIGFVAAALCCRAEPGCARADLRSRIEARPGELTLADLLGSGACTRWHELAAQVSLGKVPRSGSERVFDGGAIRRMIVPLGNGADTHAVADQRIPDRIVVRRAGPFKSCQEIASFVLRGAASEYIAEAATSEAKIDCAAAGNIPEDSALELVKTSWNARLQRWDFGLRCAKPVDCVPFLVWTRNGGFAGFAAMSAPVKLSKQVKAAWVGAAPLVQRGQTASLTWEQSGIRIVLPVTCLEAGELGQWVKVRLSNASRTLLAEVVGQGMLRANL